MPGDIETTFPDLAMPIGEIVASGANMVVRCRFEGTHRGVGKRPVNGGLIRQTRSAAGSARLNSWKTCSDEGMLMLVCPEVVMRCLFAATSSIMFAFSFPASAQLSRPGSPEADLAALDAQQKEMVAKADVDGLTSLSSPGLTINAPTNRILSRDQFLAMMRNGQIGSEAFERTVEKVSIRGDVGVVMGSELFTPTAGSVLGRTYGSHPLRRRYTNIYVLDHGRWTWLARHANVVPQPSAAIHQRRRSTLSLPQRATARAR